MADSQTVIIKKIKKGGGDGHHGGAWKVAYADFVTAMMAFFLLMWLLGATTEDQRKGIADYFNPTVPIIQVSGGGKDALNGETVFSEETLARDGSGGSRTPFSQRPAGQDSEGAETEVVIDEATDGLVEGDDTALLEDAVLGQDAEEGAGPADGDGLSQEERAKRQEELLREALADAGDGLGAHIQTKVTPRGLVIELVEVDGRPLFEVGSTRPSQTMQRLLGVVASTIRLVSNEIEIVGHTDSLGFRTARNYTNWELSTDRANAARRLLVANGFDAAQIDAVAGKADTEPLTDDPNAPQNRRISITLLRN